MAESTIQAWSGRFILRTGVALLAALAILPLADWIPGDPPSTLPPPFWPLYLAWILGFLVLGLVAWAVVRFSPWKLAGAGPSGGEKRGLFTGRWAPVLLTFVVPGLVYALISLEVFDGRPLFLDDLTQAFQAHVFADGGLSVARAQQPEFFSSLLLVESDGRVFSQFPPGWAGLLSLGLLLGVPWIIPPLCGALGTYGLYLLLRENGEGARISVFTALVFGLAPWVVFNAASWMNHVPVVTFILLGFWATLKGIRDPALWFFPGLGGAFFGVALLIRPLEAVAFGLPASVWVVVRGWKDPAFRKGLLAFALGGTAVTSLLLAYNWVQHGSPGTFGFEMQWGPGHRLGFHEAPWGPPHTFLRGLQLLNGYFLALQQVFFEAPLPSLVPALAALFLVKKSDALDRYLMVGSGLLLLGYLAFFGEGHYLGPRYLLPLAPLVAIWTVRLGRILVERTGREWMQPWVFVLILMLMVTGWLTGAQPRRFVYSISYPLRRVDVGVLETPVARNVLVFVPSPWSSKVEARLRAKDMPRQQTRWFHDRIGFCRTEVVLADLEMRGITDPLEVARELLPLTADSLAMVRDPDSGIPGDPFTGMEETEEAALNLCRQRQTLEEADGGYLMLPFFAVLGPTWTGDGPIVARDLHEGNRRLLAEYPDREAYVLRLARTRGRVRELRLVPLDPDSVEAVWSGFERLKREAVSEWRGDGTGPERGPDNLPSVLDDVGVEDPSVAGPPIFVESAVVSQTVDGGSRHEKRVVGVVVGEQALPAEADDSGKPLQPPVHHTEIPLVPHAVEGVSRRKPSHRDLENRSVGGESGSSQSVPDHLAQEARPQLPRAGPPRNRGSRHRGPCVPGARPCRRSSSVLKGG